MTMQFPCSASKIRLSYVVSGLEILITIYNTNSLLLGKVQRKAGGRILIFGTVFSKLVSSLLLVLLIEVS